MGWMAPFTGGSGTDLRRELCGTGLRGRLANGTERAVAVRAGLRQQMAVCCASACSHYSQGVGKIG